MPQHAACRGTAAPPASTWPLPLPGGRGACRRRQPPRLSFLRSQPPGSAEDGDGQQQVDANVDLVQRAQQLRERQVQLEREAQQLAAALAGLPAAEQQVVLEALGMQQQEQAQALQQALQRQEAAAAAPPQPPSTTKAEPGSAPAESTAAGSPPPAPLEAAGSPGASGSGSASWLSDLPPELRQMMQESGLAEELQRQAEAVRRDAERSTSEMFAGGDMEALARIIEEGGELPPLPEEEWEHPPEPADEFKARIQGSIDYTNADFKRSKHRKPQQQQQQEKQPGDDTSKDGDAARVAQAEAAATAAAAAQQHSRDPMAVEGAVRYSQAYGLSPAVAAAYARGWEQAREVDRMWDSGELRDATVMPAEEYTSVPAPDLPPDALRIFRAAERLAYVLRRAHIDSRDPDAPLLALQSKGLVREDLLLEDPFLQCQGLRDALGYMEQLKLAGATLDVSNIVLSILKYKPQQEWRVTIDCFLDFPYPEWFHGWVLLNQGGQAADGSSAPASTAAQPVASTGPASATGASGAAAASGAMWPSLERVSLPAIEAMEAAGKAEQERIEQEDVDLLFGMLEAAEAAATAVGHQLDDASVEAVLKAASSIGVQREQERREQAEAAAAAAVLASAAAEDDLRQRGWQPPAGAADLDPAELAPPELLEVQSEPYSHEGGVRQHRWVLMDFEQQHRQRGRQQFDLYPRHPDLVAAAIAAAEAGDEEGWGRAVSEEEEEAEQQRQYQLLPAATILAEDWGRVKRRQQQVQQGAAAAGKAAAAGEDNASGMPGEQGGREAAGGSAEQAVLASSAAGSSKGKKGKKKKKKQRKGSSDSSAGGETEQAEEQEDGMGTAEELPPFTYDWEQQQRRLEAGRLLRYLLGDKYDKAMGQLPKRGRRRGKSSNAALALEEEQEGTAWLGGECMTVQATFTYTMDASSGQVDTCGITWGSLHGLQLREPADALDIWFQATGLAHEAECLQDLQEELQLELEAEEAGEEEQGGWLQEDGEEGDEPEVEGLGAQAGDDSSWEIERWQLIRRAARAWPLWRMSE